MISPLPNAKTRLEGMIDRIFFERDDFTIGQVVTDHGQKKRFKGKLVVKPGEQVSLNGSWKNDPRYGWQFNVTSHQVNLDLSHDGLRNYLAKNPDFEGIGPQKAAAIADHFWENFEDVLFNEPEKIQDIAKVTPETVAQIQAVWKSNLSTNTVLAQLSAFGLTHHQASQLVAYHGPSVVSIFQKDPFLIIGKVPGFGFKRVDEIAQKMGMPRNAKGRIKAALVFLMGEDLKRGHSYLERSALVEQADKFLGLSSVDSQTLIDHCLKSVLEDKTLSLVDLMGTEVVALPEMVEHEALLTDKFEHAWTPNPHFRREDADFLINEVDQGEQRLLPGQRNAVANALRYTISLMSGGAGCGKTFTIQAIHQIYTKQNLTVVLCAPTGKAAKRMAQVVGAGATTIHRLLKYDGTMFRQKTLGPIDADLIIVDETSMMDVKVASELFQCVNLERTAVLLVGDHNQIEPVGPGNPLRDLIQSEAVPTIILSEVVRQAGELKANCVAILKGEVRKTSSLSDPKPWYWLDKYHRPEMILEHLVRMHQGSLEQRYGLDTLAGCPNPDAEENRDAGCPGIEQANPVDSAKALF